MRAGANDACMRAVREKRVGATATREGRAALNLWLPPREVCKRDMEPDWAHVCTAKGKKQRSHVAVGEVLCGCKGSAVHKEVGYVLEKAKSRLLDYSTSAGCLQTTVLHSAVSVLPQRQHTLSLLASTRHRSSTPKAGLSPFFFLHRHYFQQQRGMVTSSAVCSHHSAQLWDGEEEHRREDPGGS